MSWCYPFFIESNCEKIGLYVNSQLLYTCLVRYKILPTTYYYFVCGQGWVGPLFFWPRLGLGQPFFEPGLSSGSGWPYLLLRKFRQAIFTKFCPFLAYFSAKNEIFFSFGMGQATQNLAPVRPLKTFCSKSTTLRLNFGLRFGPTQPYCGLVNK